MVDALMSLCRRLADVVDARDVMLGVGLALLAAGLWQVYPPLALIVPGAICAGVAIFGVRS